MRIALTLPTILVVALAGCGPRVVDPACETYIACQAAFDDAAGVRPADTSTYTEAGDCWAGDPRTADRCVAECTESTDALRAAASDLDLDLTACADATDDAGVTP